MSVYNWSKYYQTKGQIDVLRFQMFISKVQVNIVQIYHRFKGE